MKAARPAPRMRAVILDLLHHSDATCDDLESLTGWKHQTVSARLWELERDGLIWKTQRRAQTRSGRWARMYSLV